MSEPEIMIDQQLPSRAPDLVVVAGSEEVWRVQQMSDRLSKWVGLGDLEIAGRALRELFADVSPGLDYLADEVAGEGEAIVNIEVDFRGRKGIDCSPIFCPEESAMQAGGRSRSISGNRRPGWPEGMSPGAGLDWLATARVCRRCFAR